MKNGTTHRRRRKPSSSLLLVVFIGLASVNQAASSSSSSSSSTIPPPPPPIHGRRHKIPPPPPPRPRQQNVVTTIETTAKTLRPPPPRRRPPPPPPPPNETKETSQPNEEKMSQPRKEDEIESISLPLGRQGSSMKHNTDPNENQGMAKPDNKEKAGSGQSLDLRQRDGGQERGLNVKSIQETLSASQTSATGNHDASTITMSFAAATTTRGPINVANKPPPPPPLRKPVDATTREPESSVGHKDPHDYNTEEAAHSTKMALDSETPKRPSLHDIVIDDGDNHNAETNPESRPGAGSLGSSSGQEENTATFTLPQTSDEGQTRQTDIQEGIDKEEEEERKEDSSKDASESAARKDHSEGARAKPASILSLDQSRREAQAELSSQRPLPDESVPSSKDTQPSTVSFTPAVPQYRQPPFGTSPQQSNQRQPYGIQQQQHSLAQASFQRKEHPQSRNAAASGPPNNRGRYQQPPNWQQVRRPPGKPASNSKSIPVLKSLWSRVEKGLDGLADLEDAISDRAQQLVSSVVPGKPKAPSSLPYKRQAVTKSAKQGLAGPQKRWQQQEEISAQMTKPASSKASVSMYQLNSGSSFPDKKQLDDDKRSYTPGRSSLPANARKLMPANGGASSPNDGGSWSYPGEHRFVQQNIPQGSDVGQAKNPPSQSDNAEAQPVQRAEEPRQESMVYPQQEQQQQSPKPSLDHNRIEPCQGSTAGTSQAPPSRQAEWPKTQPTKGNPWTVTSSSTPMGTEKERPPHRPSRPTPVPRRPSYLDDDDDDTPSAIARFLGAIPVPNFGKVFRLGRSKAYNDYATLDAWDAADETAKPTGGLFGIFRQQKKATSPTVPPRKKATKEAVVARPVEQLLQRSANGKSTSLLSTENKKSIRGLGKFRALLDIITLGFIVNGFRQLQGLEKIPLPQSLSDFTVVSVPSLLEAFILSLDTWAPLAFVAAMLTVWTNALLFDRRILDRATDVAETAEAEARYSRLYLRLVSSTAAHRHLPSRIFNAARLQGIALAETSRLQAFITYAMATIILMTASFIKPLLLCIAGTFFRVVSLQELRTWPLPFGQILDGVKAVFLAASKDLTSLFEVQLKGAGHHPLQVAFKLSILAALFAVSYLPSLEKRRRIEPTDEEEEDTEEVAQKMSEQIVSLGGSSATRLSFQSKRGWSESLIERWRLVHEDSSALMDDDVSSVGSLLRRIGYYISSWLILAAPILIFGLLLHIPMTGWWGSSRAASPWESILELTVLLLFTNGLVWQTMTTVVQSRDLHPDIPTFLAALAQAWSEMNNQPVSSRPLHGSVNPAAGLVVKDLWSAHVFKRAWAVRGAQLSCRNGEVLVILGDDGAGKSRLLTTLAESLVSPPKQSLTATKVRGNIFVGGIDVAQWDKSLLRKRLGLCLTDVTSLALRASMWSGLSLEEIMEPGDRMKITDPTHTTGPVEKACVVLALKITGLYWSLLPRLPSKLSTVLTANEEDLRPSTLRPRYTVISPSDWSKLLLAQVLAQALYDGENASGSTDRIDGRLAGSVLLLDDSTNMLSEVEELKLLRDLRQTGAATLLSSSKWATGRLADRIVVVKDGAIVETGTHNELLSRGPQQSLYAAKWHTMTAPM